MEQSKYELHNKSSYKYMHSLYYQLHKSRDVLVEYMTRSADEWRALTQILDLVLKIKKNMLPY